MAHTLKFRDGTAERTSIMDTRTASLGLPRRFVANAGRTGFYRVRYNGLLRDEIRGMVEAKKIPAVDRWAVQNDMFAFCLRSGHRIRIPGNWREHTPARPTTCRSPIPARI